MSNFKAFTLVIKISNRPRMFCPSNTTKRGELEIGHGLELVGSRRFTYIKAVIEQIVEFLTLNPTEVISEKWRGKTASTHMGEHIAIQQLYMQAHIRRSHTFLFSNLF